MFTRAIAALLFVLSALISAPITAGAASMPVVDWESVDITVHPEQQGAIMLITGELAQGAELPAYVELAAPSGSRIQWAGEILGGPVSQDPEVDYTVETRGQTDIYRFTLKRAPIAQLEVFSSDVIAPGAPATSVALRWTPSRDVANVRLAALMPAGAQVTRQDTGGEVQPGDSGSYYTKTVAPAPAGEPVSLEFAFASPAASGPAGGSDSSVAAGPVVAVLVTLGFLVVVAVAISRRRTASRLGDDVGAENGSLVDHDPVQGGQGGARQAASDGEQPKSETGRRRRSLSPKLMISGVVVAALAVVTTVSVIANGDVGVKKVTDVSVAKVMSKAEPDTAVRVELTLEPGTDVAHESDHVLKPLAALPGIGLVTIPLDGSYAEVNYDSQAVAEDAIVDALVQGGYGVRPQAPAADGVQGGDAGATPSGPASSTAAPQTLVVDTSNGSFSPSMLTASADSEIRITFGQAAGCLAEVVFPTLGVRQNLESGPVTVDLGTLEAGTYQFVCGMDMQGGTLVVE